MSDACPSEMPVRRLMVFGSGFIASHFALYARDVLGWRVGVVYRNFRNPELEPLLLGKLPDEAPDLSAMLERFQPTDILIAVGSSFVPAINRDIGKALDEHLNTSLFILNALLAASSVKPGRIIMIGSASEYGAFDDAPVNESHPTQPQDAYGVIKLAQYQSGLHYVRAHGLPIVHVRQFNVTGLGQNLRFVVPSICSQAAAFANRALPPGTTCSLIAGNVAVRRDFLSITDVCEAYRHLLDKGVVGDAYNVCSGVTHSINELITMASASIQLNLEVKVNQELVRESDRAKSIICGDPRKLMALGWAPHLPMEELIPAMIAHYRASGVAATEVKTSI